MNYGTCDLPNEKMIGYVYKGLNDTRKQSFLVKFSSSYSVSTHNQPFFIWQLKHIQANCEYVNSI